ncbi:hypothetical protein DSLASN_27500 [Desulfoluna limicola]|uniref:PilZ domain-containing protein n=1 Tax=Desulfoluna limicola TaxID=2810562 RepID=A0ABN6F3U4_9BACT|nr:hypothetical protein [Desulfoluna limicola]BCS97118.1 hypothetical protein DSLASN_27500 [Desulfoluna limicola]
MITVSSLGVFTVGNTLSDLLAILNVNLSAMMNERRQHPRYNARNGTYVSMLPASTCMGQLLDVSVGGLTFRYIDHERGERNREETHVFIGDDSVYLDRIPSTIIEDVPVFERSSFDVHGLSRRSAKRMRQRRVRFNGLTPDQKAQLEYFLRYRTEGRA